MARRDPTRSARVVLDVRPWAPAWLKWPLVGGVVGILTVADRPVAFAAVLGASVLPAVWVATFRVRILVDAEGGARLRTRTRSVDLGALTSVDQSRAIGFPQVSLRAGRRVGIGGFGRWGPSRWNRLLDALSPYVQRCPQVDPASRKLWRTGP